MSPNCCANVPSGEGFCVKMFQQKMCYSCFLFFLAGVWHINGEKICINATGYLLVLCLVEETRFKALLVHPGAPGVNSEKNFVSFRNTPGMYTIFSHGCSHGGAI